MPLPERDLQTFIDVTLASMNQLAGGNVVLRDPSIEFQSLLFSACTGLMHLKGGMDGFVYLTASQAFLQNLDNVRRHQIHFSEENGREVMTGLVTTLVDQLRDRLGPSFQNSEPGIFSTVPDDPIEMPPAVFVQPYLWQNELAYLILGLAPTEAV